MGKLEQVLWGASVQANILLQQTNKTQGEIKANMFCYSVPEKKSPNVMSVIERIAFLMN